MPRGPSSSARPPSSVAAASVFRPVRWEPRVYPGDLRTVGRARSDAVRDLAGFPQEVVSDAALCVSELFTNACAYTASCSEGGEVARRLSLPERGALRLEVVDGGWTQTRPAVPERSLGDWFDAEGQRGLLLVQSLAMSWGYYQVLPHPWLNLGLGVWAELPVAPEGIPAGLDRFIPTS